MEFEKINNLDALMIACPTKYGLRNSVRSGIILCAFVLLAVGTAR